MPEAPRGPATGLTPHLTIRDNRAVEAIDFYTAAFGAEEQRRMLADDGKRLMHAHLLLNGASLMLNDEFPEYQGPGDTGSVSPSGLVLHLQVDDADAWFDRAVKAGASARMPLENMFWGDRYGQIDDPFGYTWSIGAPVSQ
ncbi:VOC family protein [Sphingomonas oligophenolica]|nr:VOC family protein [Sphingomonas oligophenolica]